MDEEISKSVNGDMVVSDGDSVAAFSPEGHSPQELQRIMENVSSQDELMQALGFEQPDVDWDHGDTTRVATTLQMLQITARGAALKLNRRLDHLPTNAGGHTNEVKRLAPNMNHTLRPLFIHKHADGEAAEPHMRVAAFLAYKGGIVSRPTERTLDIPMDLWKRLPTGDALRAMNPEIERAQRRREKWERDGALARQRMAEARGE
jgi:hypothetical protein